MARTLLPIALGLLGACTTELGSTDVTRDHAGEVSVSGDAVRNDWTHDDGWLISPVLEADGGASRVGAMLTLDDEGPMPVVEVRAVRDGADTGEWKPLVSTWSEVSMHVAIAELGGVADGARLRIRLVDSTHVRSMLWNAVIPDVAAEELPEPEVSGAAEALRAELAGLGIVTRSAWGARATRCRDRDASKTRLAIHYTVTPSENAERQVRGIQRYHMDTNGWCDVGYHFLVGADGTIYEGRPLELLGAHVGGNNTGNVGIAFVGCFHPSRECAPWGPSHPPETMIHSGGRLLGRIAELYGIAPSRSTVKGHNEHRGASTSCPGDHLLARMDDLIAIGRSTPGSRDPAPAPDSPADDPSPAPPPPPPAGDACTHTYGGAYAHTACSAGYQCCDGAWRTRTSGCGTCACIEETGTLGCTPEVSPPPPTDDDGPYAGLTQSGSEIPRAGLYNGTLRSALGVSTEPYGDVVTDDGRSYVRGKVSWFGGPSDTGVSSTETGAITGERLRSLTGYFVAMRWNYSPNGRTFWRDARILVRNPSTGASVVVRPVDWGPHTRTQRIIDLSPEALSALGLDTDDEALVAFAAPGTPTGPVR